MLLQNDKVLAAIHSVSDEAAAKPSALIWDVLLIGTCLIGQTAVKNDLMLYALFVYLAVRLWASTAAYNVALLFFLIPNVGVMQLNVGGISIPLLNMLICIAFVKLSLSSGRLPFPKTHLALIGLFVAYEWAHAVYYQISSLFQLFSWTAAVLFVSLHLLLEDGRYNHMLTVKHFIAGVCVSTCLGIIDFYDTYGSLLTNNATIRFSGGAGDANYFAMYSMIAMFCMLYLFLLEKHTAVRIGSPMLFLLFSVFGFLTLSRMFLLVTIFLGLMFFMTMLFRLRKNRRLIPFVLGTVVYASLFVAYNSENMLSIIELLFTRFTDFINDPAALTSNRNLLAEQYMQLLTSGSLPLIFGIGIQDYHMRSGIFLEAHNLILELLVVWGAAGFLLFIVFIVFVFNRLHPRGPIASTSFIGWLPILCIAVSFLSINALSNESFYLLVLFGGKHIYEYSRIEAED